MNNNGRTSPPTLTVRIVRGRNWYRNLAGETFTVTKGGSRDRNVFYVSDRPLLKIQKDDCVVTAVNYETTPVLIANGAADA